ncbi:MAG: hypothetical protein R3F50_04735 [Gammaproteobacteria bacterium]|jgi:hypothetical protein
MINDEGEIHGFEIGNLLVTRKGVLRIVERIPEVTVTLKPKLFARPPQHDVFCQFQYQGQEFEIEEPWGDNSRYLISAVPPGPCPQMEFIERAFAEARSWRNITNKSKRKR